MKTYILKNIFNSLLIIFGVLTVSFILTFQLPGDPIKMILGDRADIETVNSVKSELGLDKPFYVQYVKFIGNAFKGNFGKSYLSNREVFPTILEKLPATFILSFFALLIATILGILIGIVSAVKPYSVYDTIAVIFSLFGISIPQFVLALLFVFLFASQLKILPVAGYINNGFIYIILPAISLALRPLAIITRVTRASMLDTLNKDYIRTAKSKGLSKYKIVFKHALKNSLNPIITSVSSSLAATLGGVFFIEYIFNWPGIGSLAMDSIMKLDFPMIQGTILFSAVIFVIINSLVDIFYALIDPKVKLS